MRSLLLVLLLAGCATTVVLPNPVATPETVWLLDYGRHSSLVFSRGDGTVTEYAFSEWRWSALGENGNWARFWVKSYPGTLARRTERVEPTAIRERFECETLYAIRVERERARAVLAELDERYERNIVTQVFSPANQMHYVEDPKGYKITYNCNNAVKGWLTDLGCETSGGGFFATFKLR